MAEPIKKHRLDDSKPHMFVVNENKRRNEMMSRPVTLYTILGDHEELDAEGFPVVSAETPNVLAKKIAGITGSQPKFYVKRGLNGELYNPMGMYSEGKNVKFLSKIGRDEYVFKQVNQTVFNLYINFLKTKNEAWLKNAQRELT